MDLYAYGNIANLSKIAKKNGIEIPRLRGYRLMRDEEPVCEEKIQEMIKRQAVQEAEWLCRSDWTTLSCHEYSERMDALLKHYLIFKYQEARDIRWDRIHGKRRKLLKWAIRKAEKRIRAQYAMWNKYAGRDDVLYIHSRMGDGNWAWYDGKESITIQPWFLGRVDDFFDTTYCDFYAKIKPVKMDEEKHATDEPGLDREAVPQSPGRPHMRQCQELHHGGA